MTKVLANLLDDGGEEFLHLINRLETLTGLPGEDIKLTSDIAAKIRLARRQLDIGENAKPSEIYMALQQVMALHDSFLAKKLNITKASDAPDAVKRLISQLKINKNVWVLRQSVAKRLLLENPPKKLMKHLKHRSIDSMLKHEDICELFVGMHYLESDTWLQSFARVFRKLTPSDFESRDVKIIILPAKKWSILTRKRSPKRHSVLAVNELGIVAISPLPAKNLPGITTTLLAITLGYINEIRCNSAAIKLYQMSAGFGKRLNDVLTGESLIMAMVMDQELDWPMLYRHFFRVGKASQSIFDPHLHSEDFEPVQVEEVLYHLEPALKFWHGLEFVGVSAKSGPVSFNLLDNCLNYLNHLPFRSRTYRHMQMALYDELLLKYLDQPIIRPKVTDQIEQTLIKSSVMIAVGE